MLRKGDSFRPSTSAATMVMSWRAVRADDSRGSCTPSTRTNRERRHEFRTVPSEPISPPWTRNLPLLRYSSTLGRSARAEAGHDSPNAIGSRGNEREIRAASRLRP